MYLLNKYKEKVTPEILKVVGAGVQKNIEIKLKYITVSGGKAPPPEYKRIGVMAAHNTLTVAV